MSSIRSKLYAEMKKDEKDWLESSRLHGVEDWDVEGWYSKRCSELADDELLELAESSDSIMRCVVAKLGNAPAAALDKLAGDSFFEVLFRVARNDSTPSETLLKLASREDVDRDSMHAIHFAIAGNRNCGEDALEVIASSRFPDVRAEVAYNTNSADMLRMLAEDGYEEVREAVAFNDATPNDVLGALADDEDEDVREEAKLNPSYRSEN